MKSLTRKIGQNKTAMKQLSIKTIQVLYLLHLPQQYGFATLTATVRLCHMPPLTCQTFVTRISKLYYCIIPCDTEIF